MRFLGGFTGQTTDELIALEPEYRRDSLVLAFEEAIAHKRHVNEMARLSYEERVVLAVEALEREVNNDGFDGLFSNSSREHVPYLVPALRSIGRTDVADVVQQAIDTLGLGPTPTPAAIEEAIFKEDNGRDARLNEIDRRYYEVAGDLADDVFAYIVANRNRIVIGARGRDHPDDGKTSK